MARGFTHVDVAAMSNRDAQDLEAFADSGLMVSGASLGSGLAEGQSLHAEALAPRRAALNLFQRQLDDAALLGASAAYLAPLFGPSVDDRLRFTDACQLLAGYAAARRIPLCVMHLPGQAFTQPRNVLDWLATPHPNLYLLLDTGL